MILSFYTLDVFTNTPLTGNPLAVVLDAEELDSQQMQAIAREFNLSETVFVTSPANPKHHAAVRIFTPGREVPFAGHPTIGTAVLLGLLAGKEQIELDHFVLEEKIGAVSCSVGALEAGRGYAKFKLPRLPERISGLPDNAALARGLGVEEAEIGFGAYRPAIYSAGNPFRCVPLHSREAVTKAAPQGESFEQAFSVNDDNFTNAFVYSAETLDPAHAFHARMFAPSLGVPEDPATGSAAAAFVGLFMDAEKPGDGSHAFVIEQGDAMGRPSRISVMVDVVSGKLRQAWIGGDAVIVSNGDLQV